MGSENNSEILPSGLVAANSLNCPSLRSSKSRFARPSRSANASSEYLEAKIPKLAPACNSSLILSPRSLDSSRVRPRPSADRKIFCSSTLCNLDADRLSDCSVVSEGLLPCSTTTDFESQLKSKTADPQQRDESESLESIFIFLQIEVGTPITRCPPRRSRRAELPHRAPRRTRSQSSVGIRLFSFLFSIMQIASRLARSFTAAFQRRAVRADPIPSSVSRIASRSSTGAGFDDSAI